MSTLLHDLIDLYIFPRGRREFALRAMSERARTKGHDELAAHCERSAAHDQRTRQLERDLQAVEAQGTDPQLAALDARADRTLSALVAIPEATARAMGGEPGRAARAFVDAVFPQGVYAITSLPWASQVTEIKGILELMRASHQSALAQFHLESLVEQLGEIVAQFEHRLTQSAPSAVDRDQIRARDAAGQDNLLEAVARVLGLHPSATKADVAARSVLLESVMAQSEQIRRARAQRRPPTDIDPISGGDAPEVDA